MANGTCPPPFLDAALYSSTEGNIYGRLCSDITLPGATPGATCCLPCPVQGYVLQPHILTALHANDIMNAIGIVVGAFVLLVLPRFTDLIASHLSSFPKRLLTGVLWV